MTDGPTTDGPKTEQTARANRVVLVVDDDRVMRTLLTRVLAMEGYDILEAEDGDTALTMVETQAPDLILLDVMMPVRDGLEILEELRKRSDVPVVLVSARGDEADRVIGLKMGADDYVVKPFSAAELSARVESVLRRAKPNAAFQATAGTSGAAPGRRLLFSELTIDLDTREVQVRGAAVETTAREFDLLAFLAGEPRRVFSRQQLLEQVWSSSPDWQSEATVTEHVRRLRRKVEDDPDRPRWLTTVRGVGYRFEP